MDNSTLLYAFVSGLRPKIANFVFGRNPDNKNAAIDDAKIGELSTDEGTAADNWPKCERTYSAWLKDMTQ